MIPPDDKILTLRLEAVRETQKRARLAFFIMLFAVVLILTGLWNSYLSWDRSHAFKQKPDNSEWSRQETVSQAIKTWVETQLVSINLLGIKVSTSDVVVLGSVGLWAILYFYYLCVRRANHDMGRLLFDTWGKDDVFRESILASIETEMVLLPSTREDNPMDDLRKIRRQIEMPPSTKNSESQFSAQRIFLNLLDWLPFITVLLVLASEVYYLTGFYDSPFEKETGWKALEYQYKAKVILMDLTGVIFCCVIFRLSQRVRRFHKATLGLIRQYRGQKPPSELERRHLTNLAGRQTASYRGCPPLRAELRRLDLAGLIKNKAQSEYEQISGMQDNAVFDLADFVELTEEGEKWVRIIREMEGSEHGNE